jgi:MSHA biogenesis protein MshN
MSLLNDALRAAEQRQSRPKVAAAYAGQSQSRPRPRYGLWVVIVFLVAGAVGASAFWLMTGTGNEDIPVHVSAPPAQEAGTELQLESVAGNDNTAEASQPAPEPPVVVQSEPEAREVAEAVEPQKPEPEPAVTTPVVAEAETAQESEAPTPPIKQVRETPEAIDRRVSRELASLLRSGETRQAEQTLQELASAQAATASREVFARQMLVQEMPDRALAWLPESVTSGDAGLRLLRARALHAKGSLPEALATLESSVPAVRQAVEYRVTLATLLQQAGRTTDAARHWSALIAEDDSRAAWWVGLAIALETGGETNSAVRAYSQAAQLPGLSPSLANYVRERLKALQAG